MKANNTSFFSFLNADDNLINKTYSLPLSYPVDSCLYKPCENGGQCVKNEITGEEKLEKANQTELMTSVSPIQPDTYRCRCETGWFGKWFWLVPLGSFKNDAKPFFYVF